MVVGVIGSNGYWGPKHVRALKSLGHKVLTCDLRGEADFKDYKNTQFVYAVEAVVIATPPITHYPIAKWFLERRTPVLIEKPMTTYGPDSWRLMRLARKHKVRCAVGHTYLYSPGYRKLTQLLTSCIHPETLEYVDIQWKSLGLFQRGGVVMDLAPHPLSIIMGLFNPGRPKTVSCNAYCHKIKDIPDTAFISLDWEKFQVNLNLSWIDPHKVRKMTFVFKDCMIVWDDLEPIDKVKLFDKSASVEEKSDNLGTFNMSYRYGDTIIYKTDSYEPMIEELKNFLSEDPIISTPEMGHEVVRIIGQCQ